ncbi:MAG: radical SAM protein [Spirochaetales bacterium]|nr:radical SAM protein [Spirochaetales bacterium]
MKTNFSVVPQMINKSPRLAARTAKSFLLNSKTRHLDYRFLRGRTQNLALVYMKLTPMCNLRCVMCGQRGDKGVLKGKYALDESKKILSLEEYKKFIDQMWFHRPLFYLWGGEPFMYPHLMDLSAYIVKKGMGLTINTNGTYLEENAERIVKDKWGAIFISLDGFEDVNDKIRGKGSYQKVMNGIKALDREKKKQNSQLPHVGIVSVVSNMNYLHLDELVVAGQDYGLSWHIINLGTYTNDSIVQQNTQFYQDTFGIDHKHLDAYNTGYNNGIDGEKLSGILDKIHDMNSKYPIITVPKISSSKIGEYYSHPETVVRSKCPIPWSQVNINYNGDVHFCADYPDYTLGNIKDEKFFKIYNNEKAVKFRKELKKTEHGLFPGCLRCYQNMLFGKRMKGF